MDRIKNHILYQKCKGKTIIAHAGHRDLLEGDLPKISSLVSEKLRAIIQGKPRDFILLTGIAEGADELVAKCAVKLGIKVYLLAISEKDFKGFEQGDEDRINQLQTAYEAKAVEAISLASFLSSLSDSPYLILRDVLVRHSKHLILLWDGVDSGLSGGTGDVWRAFRKKESLKKKLWHTKEDIFQYHLFTPRKSNLIPSAHSYIEKMIFPREVYDWETTKITLPQPHLLQRLDSGFRAWRENKFPDSLGLFLRSVVPFLIGVFVLLFGIIGYNVHYGKDPFINSPFFSINLITFNASEFNDFYNYWLQSARILGALLATYGFLIALYFAAGKENLDRILFKIKRNAWDRTFIVVIGLNEMALDIVKDLRNGKPFNKLHNVVILNSGANEGSVKLARNEGAWVISGQPTDRISLQKTHFQKADKVFVVTGSDEDNVRAVLEMDRLVLMDPKSSVEDWYVHIYGKEYKHLINQSISAKTNYLLTVFSHSENSARRVIAYYPEIRVPGLNGEEKLIVILGFGELGRELVTKTLQQHIYAAKTKTKLLVYHHPDESEKVNRFKKQYAYLFPSDFPEAFPTLTTENWTFFPDRNSDQLKNRVQIEALPAIYQELLHPAAILTESIFSAQQAKIFSCLSSGLDSASLLTTLLPGLELIKIKKASLDIQAYCFYNFPDEEEEAYLEKKLNALAPHVPVKCFGNYLSEFSCAAIENQEADHLAKQIALWYYLLYDCGTGIQNLRNVPKVDELFEGSMLMDLELGGLLAEARKTKDYKEQTKATIKLSRQLWYTALSNGLIRQNLKTMMRHCWKSLSETDREGNRQAADHLWVKVTEFDKSWELSDKVPDLQDFKNFWTAKEIRDLSKAEHRRWNTMKVLDGWRPFEGDDWKLYKENYKAQKLHSLLLPFNELPPHEVDKDYHQIEGIPFFIAFLYKAYYRVNIDFQNLKPNL